MTGISEEPLTDGNHFGQTVINDFGRPYQEGFNSVDGISAWTTAGVGWATFALNTNTPHQLRLSPIARGNLLLRSTSFLTFRPLRRFPPLIAFDCLTPMLV